MYMAGFSDKLAAIKALQETASKEKSLVESAGEQRESPRSELLAERDAVLAELSQVEQTAQEAQEAVSQADAFIAEQGEHLDLSAKAEIDVLKIEAGEAQRKFEELKTKLETLNAQIDAFETSETDADETPNVGEMPAEEQTAEQPAEVAAQLKSQEVQKDPLKAFDAMKAVSDQARALLESGDFDAAEVMIGQIPDIEGYDFAERIRQDLREDVVRAREKEKILRERDERQRQSEAATRARDEERLRRITELGSRGAPVAGMTTGVPEYVTRGALRDAVASAERRKEPVVFEPGDIVKVQRPDGTIEGGWQIQGIGQKIAYLSNEKQGLSKDVSIEDLARWQA